jgi:Tfp pilus assembly protein PilV
MVETLVAFLLLVLGVLATFQLLDTSRRTSLRAEESQALNDIGQRELEQIRALDYEEIALNGAPVTNANENHPGSRVTGTPPGARFHLDPESPTTR